jgi:very-short-patch-repair endonuclease
LEKVGFLSHPIATVRRMKTRSDKKPMSPLRLALGIAEGQCGLITLEQTRECGISKDMLYRLLASGEWSRELPGVFRIFSPGDPWLERCSAVALWLGDSAALSYRAAAAWWVFDTFERDVIEFSSITAKECPWPDVILHRVKDWRSSDRGRSGHMWITSPTRTLIDLASLFDRDELEMALETALRRKLTSVGRLERAIERQGGRGRKGIGQLLRLLEIRGHVPPTESPMETRFIQFVRRWRLPVPVRQHVVANGKRRYDFFYPHAQLLIEVDSYERHSSRSGWSKDQTKGNGATVLGLRTFRVTKELMDDPQTLARDLLQALGQGDLF